MVLRLFEVADEIEADITVLRLVGLKRGKHSKRQIFLFISL